MNSVITLTFGDQAENHVGMEQLGEMVKEGQGFNYNDLIAIQKRFEKIGADTLLINLSLWSIGNDSLTIEELSDLYNKKWG